MRCVVASLVLLVGACDARVSPVDAGSDSGPSVPMDAGHDAGPTCTEHVIAPFSGAAPCSVATRDCAAACGDARCAEDCFLADASSQCIQCWDANQLSCWNRNGCQSLWNCLSECIQTNCPTADPACIGDNCSAEDQAYADCFEPLRPMCLERTIDCLPE